MRTMISFGVALAAVTASVSARATDSNFDDVFTQAGFREVATTKMAAPFRLASAHDYLDFVRSSAGPILRILEKLDHAAERAAWADMEQRLDKFKTPTGWVGPNELLLTAGRR